MQACLEEGTWTIWRAKISSKALGVGYTEKLECHKLEWSRRDSHREFVKGGLLS